MSSSDDRQSLSGAGWLVSADALIALSELVDVPVIAVSGGAVVHTNQALRTLHQPARTADDADAPASSVRGLSDPFAPFLTGAMLLQPLGEGAQLELRWVEPSEWRRVELLRDQHRVMDSMARFAGGVAHDYNNLLAVVLQHAELAERAALALPDAPVSLIESVREIARISQRGAALARSLLVLARQSATEPSVIDVDAALFALRPELERVLGAGIELVLEVGSGAKRLAFATGQLEQVLLQLARNARDAMGGVGECRVAASLVRLPPRGGPHASCAGHHVRLAVSDTGVGVPEEVVPHIFEPFFSTKPEPIGRGLGLSLAYAILRAAGGELVLEPGPGGRGATFACYAPLASTEERSRVSSRPPPARRSGPTQRTRILVVDDERPLRRAVARLLAEVGYDVAQAASASAALRMCDERAPDLVLTDVVMPGQSGAELALLLAERHPDVRVVFMSGYPADSLRHCGLDPGQLSYLQKPFSRTELLTALAHQLGSDLAVASGGARE